MFTNKELVENIRELAKKNGTSLTKIEKKLGWGNGKIGKWESAKKTRSWKPILRNLGRTNEPVFRVQFRVQFIGKTIAHEFKINVYEYRNIEHSKGVNPLQEYEKIPHPLKIKECGTGGGGGSRTPT